MTRQLTSSTQVSLSLAAALCSSFAAMPPTLDSTTTWHEPLVAWMTEAKRASHKPEHSYGGSAIYPNTVLFSLESQGWKQLDYFHGRWQNFARGHGFDTYQSTGETSLIDVLCLTIGEALLLKSCVRSRRRRRRAARYGKWMITTALVLAKCALRRNTI